MTKLSNYLKGIVTNRYFQKAVTWRTIASVVTMIFLYIITGKLEVTLGYGLVEAAIKVGLYILHEKVWEVWFPRGK